MSLLSSTLIGYIATYLVLMVPTYLLPYFGSNSAVMNAVSAGMGLGISPLWWIHAWCLAMLVVLAYARGKRVKRPTLFIFPLLAAVFDLVPGLSMIPLVPTVMHVLALIFGVKAQPITGSDGERAASAPGKGATLAGAVVSAVAVGGVAVSMASLRQAESRARARMLAPAVKAVAPAMAPQPEGPAPVARPASPPASVIEAPIAAPLVPAPSAAVQAVDDPAGPPAPQVVVPAPRPVQASISRPVKPPVRPAAVAPPATVAPQTLKPREQSDPPQQVRHINLNDP